MEQTIDKVRLTIYVDRSLHRWLWMQRAETGRSVSEIAADLMIRRIGRDAHDREVRDLGATPVAG